MNLSKVILQIEKTRNKLISVELSDQEKLLEISRKMDELILEYYRLTWPKRAVSVQHRTLLVSKNNASLFFGRY